MMTKTHTLQTQILQRPFAFLLLFFVSGLVSAQSNDTQNKCMPVAGNWHWTHDDEIGNRRLVENLKKNPGAVAVDPVANTYRSRYMDCLLWMNDSDVYIVRDIARSYEGIHNSIDLFDTGSSIALAHPAGWLVPNAAAKVGLRGLLAAGSGSSLSELLFDNPDQSLTKDLVNEFHRQRNAPGSPNDAQIVEGLTSRLRGLGLETETVTWVENTLAKAALSPRGQPAVDRASGSSKAADAAALQANGRIKEAKQRVVQMQGNLGNTAERGAASMAAANFSSSRPLRDAYIALVSQYGEGGASSLLSAAAGDDEKSNLLGLTGDEASLISKDVEARRSMRESADQARQASRSARDLAGIAEALNWSEGARVFGGLAEVSNAYAGLLESLAGTAMTPPGPWQMVSAANQMFAMAGGLQRVFGGGAKRSDGGMKKSMEQIFKGLQTLSEQLRELRREQQDHFAYAERNLEVLVEVAAVQALDGVQACRRTSLLLAEWASRTGGTDARDAIASDAADPSLALRAKQCHDWLRAASTMPFGPGGVNVLFKQRLHKAAEVAARHPQANAGFKNRGFHSAERDYPALRALLDDEDVPMLLGDRRSWHDPLSIGLDIGPRMMNAGHVVGGGWRMAEVSLQLLSAPTVAAIAESSLLLKPATAMLEDTKSLADSDRAFGVHASIEREMYALVLVALAQERLMSGVAVAERIEAILHESDVREKHDRFSECTARRQDAVTCGWKAGQPPNFVIENCTPKPVDNAPTFCGRWGKVRFEQKVADAKVAVRSYPVLRQNVLMARLWRMSNKHQLAADWAPRYRLAVVQNDAPTDLSADPAALILRRIFPDLLIQLLGKTEVVNGSTDVFMQHGRYFTRLTGQCSGIAERVLSTRAVCKAGHCDLSVGVDKDGKSRVLDKNNKPHSDDEEVKSDVCVMAALPTPDQFERSTILLTSGVERLELLAAQLAMSIGFDKAYLEMGNDDRAKVVRKYRPAGPLSSFGSVARILSEGVMR